MSNETQGLRKFEAELLPMLADAAQATTSVAEAPRLVRRDFRWRRWALVAALGLPLAVAVPLMTDDPLGGALAIDQRGDTIFVSVEDAQADPEAMTNDLRAKGVPAKVETVPVSPSLEGAWVDIVNDNLSEGYNDPRITDVVEQLSERPEVLELPADFSTPFTLVVGRPAEADETWQIAHESDVLGAYQCLGLEGMSPQQADEKISDRGYEPWWYYHRSDAPQTDRLDEAPVDKVIIGAEFHGPSIVIVHTADKDSEAKHDSASQAPAEASC